MDENQHTRRINLKTYYDVRSRKPTTLAVGVVSARRKTFKKQTHGK